MRKLGLRLLAVAVVCLPVLAQEQGRGPVRISVSDPRPLAVAAETLEGRFGWIITYEDPQWLAGSEIQDVTTRVRRDGRFAPRVLVPKGGLIDFDVLPAAWGFRGAERIGVVQDLVLANSSAKNPGTFRVQESYGRLNIVPLTAKDSSERVTPQQSILDSTISLDERQWNGLALLKAFTEQLSRTTGVLVVPGTVPLNTLANHIGTYGADQETARDFLSRFLNHVGPGYSWHLFFDPSDRMYALNIHRITPANTRP